MRGSNRSGLVATTATLAVAGALLVAPVANAAPLPGASDAAGTGNKSKSAAAGFVPVKQLAEPLGAVSPSKGELWIATAGSGGAVAMEHLKSGRWTTETIDAGYDGVGGADLSATARDDVWLSVAGTLRHYDGKSWVRVANPTAANGAALAAGPVAAAGRGTVYAVMREGTYPVTNHVYRYSAGRWTEIGAPIPNQSFNASKIVPVGGGVSVLGAGPRSQLVYDFRNGAWSQGRVVATMAGGQYDTVGYFEVTSGFQHLVLGGGGMSGRLPRCVTWKPSADGQCTSTVVTGAGARLKNGSLVLGGDDYDTPYGRPEPSHKVEGTFALRAANGTERPLAGDPGEQTVAMIPEAHQNSAWAITADRPTQSSPAVYTLQRYDG